MPLQKFIEHNCWISIVKSKNILIILYFIPYWYRQVSHANLILESTHFCVCIESVFNISFGFWNWILTPFHFCSKLIEAHAWEFKSFFLKRTEHVVLLLILCYLHCVNFLSVFLTVIWVNDHRLFFWIEALWFNFLRCIKSEWEIFSLLLTVHDFTIILLKYETRYPSIQRNQFCLVTILCHVQ